MNKFIASEEVWYDEDKMLWGCYVGKSESKLLYATAWGRSKDVAMLRANAIAHLLNDFKKENK